MPAWIGIVLTILGSPATADALAIVEKLLGDIATYVASAFKTLYPTGSDAALKLEGALNTAAAIAVTVEADLPAATAFVKNTYADLEALLAAEPWLAKMLYSSTQIKAATGTDQGTANKLNEAAHAKIALAKS